MFTFLSLGTTRLDTDARLGRIIAALAALTGGVLAWAATVPAASAATLLIPDPGAGGAYGPAPAATGRTVRVITSGGIPGWQITLIALAAAIAAVFLDRARAGRRSASATG